MFRIVLYALIAMMVWTALKTYEPDPTGTFITTTDVNLRAGPTTDAAIQALLPAGTQARQLRQQGDWSEVETPLGVGWVSMRFVRPAP